MESPKPIDQSSISLADGFRHDLDDIARALIQAFELRFTEEVPNLSEPLPRWFDFRFRYVEPKPRHVALSDRITNALPLEVQPALISFLKRVASGEDINPYQGRGLKLRNDTSGHDHSSRTDFLFAAWDILHFHLSDEPIPPGRYFSRSADWLAFGIITDQQFVLIDVLRHPDREGFSDPTLLETVARCWPGYMEHFRIKRPSPGERPLTQEETHSLRTRGVNAPFVYNGNTYMGPGGGYTSAGTTMRTAAALAHIVRTFGPLAEAVRAPEGPYRTHSAVSIITEPHFSLRLYGGGLGVYEEHSQTLFVQPPGPESVIRDLRWLSDLMVPPWALLEIAKQKDRFGELFCEIPGQPPGGDSA